MITLSGNQLPNGNTPLVAMILSILVKQRAILITGGRPSLVGLFTTRHVYRLRFGTK